MRTLTTRYAAWCRRQGTMACNPGVIGFGILLVVCLIAGYTDRELTVHRAGFMQLVAGTGAALACLAAALLITGAMRIVESTPVPVKPALEQAPPLGRRPATITAMTLRPEERAEMEAEADLLAAGDTTLLVSGNGAVYGLQDEPEDAS